MGMRWHSNHGRPASGQGIGPSGIPQDCCCKNGSNPYGSGPEPYGSGSERYGGCHCACCRDIGPGDILTFHWHFDQQVPPYRDIYWYLIPDGCFQEGDPTKSNCIEVHEPTVPLDWSESIPFYWPTSPPGTSFTGGFICHLDPANTFCGDNVTDYDCSSGVINNVWGFSLFEPGVGLAASYIIPGDCYNGFQIDLIGGGGVHVGYVECWR